MRRGSLIYKDTELRQADLPSEGGADLSADAATTSRGSGGLTHQERPSVWELLTESSDEVAGMSTVAMLLRQLDESPRFRRGEVASAMVVIARELQKVSWQTDASAEVSLQVGTVVVLADLLLRHQP